MKKKRSFTVEQKRQIYPDQKIKKYLYLLLPEWREKVLIYSISELSTQINRKKLLTIAGIFNLDKNK